MSRRITDVHRRGQETIRTGAPRSQGAGGNAGRSVYFFPFPRPGFVAVGEELPTAVGLGVAVDVGEAAGVAVAPGVAVGVGEDVVAPTAAAAFTRPFAQSVPVPLIRSAVDMIRSTTALFEVPYTVAQTRAATPLTCGVAIDVPVL
jgi:hypothetical protein